MIAIDERFIETLAPNANASKNGRKLAETGKFPSLCITDDKQVVFGKCQGSGASVYECSVDFVNAAQPVPRCSCPSRQYPCKHCLGLLFAFVQMPGKFCQTELPQEVAGKRERAAKTAERRAERAKKPAAPRKVNRRALQKKLQTQHDALDLLQNLLTDMLTRGLGNHGQKEAHALKREAQMLRAAYLPGAELALLRLSNVVSRASQARNSGDGADYAERGYLHALDELARLEALIRRGKDYLNARLQDPQLAPETESSIAAWLGHAWQYTQLQEAGLGQPASELLQLAFFIHDDPIKQEYADTGVWFDLRSAALHYTETLRPYKAVNFIQREESAFDVACVADFVRYPGQGLQRIRWRESTVRAPSESDYQAVQAAAVDDFTALIKSVRGELKHPLASRYQLALVKAQQIGRVDGGHYVIEDAAGTRIELADPQHEFSGIPPTCSLLPLLGRDIVDAALLCRFNLDLQSLRLSAQPLTFVHRDGLTRLAY